jgi:hypothetical protein
LPELKTVLPDADFVIEGYVDPSSLRYDATSPLEKPKPGGGSLGDPARHFVCAAKPRRLPRVAAALGLVALGAGISLHLLGIHVSYWWLPLVVVLVLAHAAIISGIAWLATRHRRNPDDASARRAGHEHGDHSHVLRNPHAYDWLARAITLGGERKFRQRTLDL